MGLFDLFRAKPKEVAAPTPLVPAAALSAKEPAATPAEAQKNLGERLRGWTPIFIAANLGDPQLAAFFRASGAKTKATIDGQDVALEIEAALDELNACLLEAAEHDDLANVRRWLAEGADVNCATRDGWTPLLIAAVNEPPLVKLLLEHGADPNQASERGYTPLMRAGGKGQEEIVRLLLAAGADPLLRDCDGATALRLTRGQQEFDCADLIAEAHVKALMSNPTRFAQSGSSEFVPLPGAALMMVELSRASVGGEVRKVDLNFDDGTALRGVRLIDELVMELPPGHASRGIKSVSVPRDQNIGGAT